MATALGRSLIIQRPDPDNVGEWLNLCGMETTSFTLSNEISEEKRIDCQNRENPLQTVIEFGAQSMAFEGSGLFDDDANGKWTTDKMLAQTKEQLRVFVPKHGFFTSSDGWAITTCSFNGPDTGSLQASVSLKSSGIVQYTAL